MITAIASGAACKLAPDAQLAFGPVAIPRSPVTLGVDACAWVASCVCEVRSWVGARRPGRLA